MIHLQRLPSTLTASRVTVGEHAFDVDIDRVAGGEDIGPDPHDLYDAALGACKSLTIMWLAGRKGWDVQDVQVTVTRDASAERQGVYKLTAAVAITGSLTPEQFQALQLAAEKCPVHKLMTQVTTEVTTEVTTHAVAQSTDANQALAPSPDSGT